MMRMKTIFGVVGMLFMVGVCLAADKEHGTLVQESPIFVSPDVRASRVGTATRGLDTFLMERSTIEGKPWAHVLVTIQEGLVYPKQVSGWVDGRFVILRLYRTETRLFLAKRRIQSERQKIAADARTRARMQHGFTTACMNTSPRRHWRQRRCGMRLTCAGNWRNPAFLP